MFDRKMLLVVQQVLAGEQQTRRPINLLDHGLVDRHTTAEVDNLAQCHASDRDVRQLGDGLQTGAQHCRRADAVSNASQE